MVGRRVPGGSLQNSLCATWMRALWMRSVASERPVDYASSRTSRTRFCREFAQLRRGSSPRSLNLTLFVFAGGWLSALMMQSYADEQNFWWMGCGAKAVMCVYDARMRLVPVHILVKTTRLWVQVLAAVLSSWLPAAVACSSLAATRYNTETYAGYCWNKKMIVSFIVEQTS